MAAEIWRDIPGYEGAYQVSSLGRVRSLDRVVVRSDGRRQRVRSRVLRQQWNRRLGYYYVTLMPGNKNRRVHKLVAEAFIGPCPVGFEVRHMDGNAGNNAASNMAYGTRADNEADKVRHGTRQPQCKLSPEDVRRVRGMLRDGVSCEKIANNFGVSERTIFRVKTGRTYRWVA